MKKLLLLILVTNSLFAWNYELKKENKNTVKETPWVKSYKKRTTSHWNKRDKEPNAAWSAQYNKNVKIEKGNQPWRNQYNNSQNDKYKVKETKKQNVIMSGGLEEEKKREKELEKLVEECRKISPNNKAIQICLRKKLKKDLTNEDLEKVDKAVKF